MHRPVLAPRLGGVGVCSGDSGPTWQTDDWSLLNLETDSTLSTRILRIKKRMKYSEYKCPGGETDGAGSGAATPTQLNPIQRKKKPKRRSTGVVNLEMEVSG